MQEPAEFAMDSTYAVPCPSFNLKLSHWDRRFLPMYSKRLLCFPSSGKPDKGRIVRLLLEALKHTVEEIPFLAGSIVPFSKDQPWLRDVRAEGSAYLEVKDLSREKDYLTLRNKSFSSSLLDATLLCPLPEASYAQETSADVCRFRANFLDGGLILVVQMAHTIFDGRGISNVLKVFTTYLRKAQAGELASPPSAPQTSYSFDRTLHVSGHGTSGGIANHPCWTASPLKMHGGFPSTKNICANFRIDCENLQGLKTTASSTSLRISTHDAIAALLWRSLVVARHRAGILHNRDLVSFATAVDCRSRLGLPDPYFGNVIYGVKVSLPLASIVSGDTSILQAIAKTIRAEINTVTAEKFQDLLGFVERTDVEMLTRLSVIEDLSIGTVMLVSYYGFDMHALDFGEAFGYDGRIEAFRLPSRGLVPGMPILHPRLPDGSCEFVMNEPEEVMHCLAQDEVFGRFAKEQH